MYCYLISVAFSRWFQILQSYISYRACVNKLCFGFEQDYNIPPTQVELNGIIKKGVYTSYTDFWCFKDGSIHL